MKILIVTSILPPEIGGPATYVPEIIKRLGRKYQFKILTFTPHPSTPFSDVPVISVSRAGGFLRRQQRLLQHIFAKRHWANFIYAQDPLVVGLTSVLVGKLLGKKVVVRYGGDPAWEAAFGQEKTKKLLLEFLQRPDGGIKPWLDVLLTRLSFSLFDKIITNSQFLKEVIQKNYGVASKKIVVIHNAIEIGSLPRRQLAKKKDFLALSFGRLVSWKKYDEIIEAIARINKRGKIKVKLTIFGDGPERENLKKLGKGFLKLLPSKSHREALEYLRRADVYVLNSLYEGSPNQVIEAFSVGTPVVATDIPGTNEAAINNKTALTVKPGDVQNLSLAIEKILTDKLFAQKLVAGGKKMLDNFSWTVATKQLESVLGAT